MTTLRQRFGDIDVYLFDQLLRGAVPAGSTVLDPLKTTIVHGRRSMMTWVARRGA